MKFARDFKESLASQGFPPHWVEQAVPYRQLKKCLKKVQRELQDLGLDPDTLRSLTDPENKSPVALKYRLHSSADSKLVRPALTVHVKDGVVVDASLTPATRRFFENLAIELAANRRRSLGDTPGGRDENGADPAPIQLTGPDAIQLPFDKDGYETIEVPLEFDNQFFEMLQSDVNNIDALQADEQKNMAKEISALRDEISLVSKPSRFSKTDLALWRHIFELYLDAEVFFATGEQNHGERTSQAALTQLQWFQSEVEKRRLARDFRLRESHSALDRFLKLNASLLKNLQFQELNRLAVLKILKKFDKRTSLGISKTFRTFVQSRKLMAGSIGKDVCAQLSQELVPVVPQLNDYLCPVCFAIAYRPVRLACQHVFCIRCIVKIQRRQEKHCPLCRSDAVLKASADNLDIALGRYMKKYFRKEVKEKQRANDIERGIEDYGPTYTHKECVVM
ncbi:putative RING finger proteinc-like protein [Hapsidospora chrysogenum ATCC 11550]|uniref:Putative RING finger proteinc-like protein n=1 Tax=Hapsidospora chrysogenum (strain ATCC 11550 / CBS 779.69 / DSM 880 / IAM 14645 / JCM 23072 / IMI 49137) TaxID=857340 RepID=A0A086T0N4_HAPC1|nr:putative RING finger proteinc-like protein [Hapsidospora chrysogenum ATCC 11550]